MDSFATLRRRTTDLLQSLPQSLPALPKPGGGGSGPSNTLKGTWERIDIPPLPRSSHSVSIVSGSAYIFGGEVNPREPVDNDMHIIKLPASGASADYWAVKAKPSKPTAATTPNVPGIPAAGKSEMADVSLKDETSKKSKPTKKKSEEDDSDEEDDDSDEEDDSEEDESDEEDSEEDEDDSEEDEDDDATAKPKDKGKGTAPPEPVFTDVPAPRVGHAAAVIGTRIFVFGGRGGPDMAPLDEGGRVWVFETKTHSWTPLNPANGTHVPPPRSYHAATALDKPRDFFVPDPAAAPGSPGKPPVTWADWAAGDSERVGIPQNPIVGVVSATASDEEEAGYGTFIIHGGCLADAGARTNDLWAFDVRSRTWQELPSAPGAPRGGTAICVSKGRLYRFGGFNGQSQEGGQLDVLELGVGVFDDGRTGVPGEAIISARGDWHSLVPGRVGSGDTAETEDWPGNRSVCSLEAITVGGGREWLVLMLGEHDASSQGHAGAGKFWDDVWAFQVPPLGMSTASVSEAIMSAFGRRSTEGKWFRVEASPYDDDNDDTVPGHRGWVASAAMGDVEENGVLVWGGLNEDNKRLGDGYIFRLN